MYVNAACCATTSACSSSAPPPSPEIHIETAPSISGSCASRNAAGRAGRMRSARAMTALGGTIGGRLSAACRLCPQQYEQQRASWLGRLRRRQRAREGGFMVRNDTATDLAVAGMRQRTARRAAATSQATASQATATRMGAPPRTTAREPTAAASAPAAGGGESDAGPLPRRRWTSTCRSTSTIRTSRPAAAAAAGRHDGDAVGAAAAGVGRSGGPGVAHRAPWATPPRSPRLRDVCAPCTLVGARRARCTSTTSTWWTTARAGRE